MVPPLVKGRKNGIHTKKAFACRGSDPTAAGRLLFTNKTKHIPKTIFFRDGGGGRTGVKRSAVSKTTATRCARRADRRQLRADDGPAVGTGPDRRPENTPAVWPVASGISMDLCGGYRSPVLGGSRAWHIPRSAGAQELNVPCDTRRRLAACPLMDRPMH